jgi:hypothetical protein
MRPSNTGRVLINRNDARVAVVPSVRGEACYVAELESIPFLTGCVQDFPESGVMFTYSRSEVMPSILMGLAADDVSSIEVETSDGERHQLSVENGAVWWQAPSSALDIESATITRSGSRYVERDVFRPATPPKVD